MKAHLYGQMKPPGGSRRAERTDAPVAPELLAADVEAVLDTLAGGGVAIIPTCLTYAIVAHQPAAIERIFAAKRRSYDKPCGLFGSPAMSDLVHDLVPGRRVMIGALMQAGLPFSVVAPYRAGCRLLAAVPPGTLGRSSRAGTMDMVVSGGPFVAALAARSLERGVAVFGSSANLSLQGSHYRLDEVEPEVRAAADLELDYGVSRYATPEGLSSTIIDLGELACVRRGHCYGAISGFLRANFGVSI